MKKWIIVLLFCMSLTPNLFAAEKSEAKMNVFSSFFHFEGRGLSNALLFPAEWGHLPKSEYRNAFGWPLSAGTHMVGRIFSGITDIVFMPIAYPLSGYSDSIPVGMGWGEYPWQKSNG